MNSPSQTSRSIQEIARAAKLQFDTLLAAMAVTFDGPQPALAHLLPAGESLVSTLRAIQAARRARRQFFDPSLFAEPGWEMLLELAVTELEGGRISISGLCHMSGSSPTTALRHIRKLESSGLIQRHPDTNDERRTWVRLTERGGQALANYTSKLMPSKPSEAALFFPKRTSEVAV